MDATADDPGRCADLGFDLDVSAIRAAMLPFLPGLPLLTDPAFTAPPPSRGWLPVATFWWRDQLCMRWSWFGAKRLRDPFFGGSAQRSLFQPFNRFFPVLTTMADLGPWLESHPGLAPNGFIFHMSRCGSTLVSQMLATPAGNIAISEAAPIDDVLRAAQIQPALSEDAQARWLTWMVEALGQPRNGEHNYFIKLDCWHTAWLPLFRRAFPAVPWIFLYRDPVEVLVSHRIMPGALAVPGIPGQDLFGLDHLFQPDDLDGHIARFLAAVCAPVARDHARYGGLLVNYRELPGAMNTRILPHFGIAASTDDQIEMDIAARYDAKMPGSTFAPDEAVKQQAATEAVRTAADRYLGDVYRRLERDRLR